MRVIAGTYRSRPLAAPRGARTRPTSDRLRETLFNILAPRIAGARFADLYAGTGAVGIEALSRGSSHVWFAEKASPALAAIRANLNSLGISSGYSIEDRGALPLLQELARSGSTLDIVFFDPPWEASAEYSAVLDVLGGADATSLLTPDSLLVAEHSSRVSLPARAGKLIQTRTRNQGDAALSFYVLNQDPG